MNTDIEFKVDFDGWENIDIDSSKFIFSQAEKELDATIKLYDSTSSRIERLLALTVPSIIGITSFLMNQLSDPQTNSISAPSWLLLLMLLPLSVTLVFLVRSYFPMASHSLGAPPKYLFEPSFFQEKEDFQTVQIILSECERYQACIELNDSVNSKRIRRVTISLISLICAPPIGLVAFLVQLYGKI